MTLNPQYEDIGKGFVQQYYALFDNPVQRANVINFYSSLTFQKITRVITAVDSQPMFDGGVLINVLGRLQCDEDPPLAYSQIFVLKPMGGTFFCAHDIFRLNIHNSA
uniref:NTF2 domain-containing protein n=1 Tax=Glossina austeni TaxID=7395 RepID=A0A1A9UHZ3_GLOAU